jgi:hypothetical protein
LAQRFLSAEFGLQLFDLGFYDRNHVRVLGAFQLTPTFAALEGSFHRLFEGNTYVIVGLAYEERVVPLEVEPLFQFV